MHKNLPRFYHFINQFDKNHIRKLDKKIAIIYRNYSKKSDENLILEIKNYCKKVKKKFFIARDFKLAVRLNLDGVYLPSFYKTLNTKISLKKKFIIIGSAHSIKEIKIKEKQGAELIFISPIFSVKKKKNLNVIKFNYLTLSTKKSVIALGGINDHNFNKLRSTNSVGFAAISYFSKHGNINSLIYAKKNEY
jgi:thiamine-phosphate pyrophosphorylase